MSELREFVKRMGRFIKLGDGESTEAVYKGYKLGTSAFDGSKEIVLYSLETANGLKILKSGSCSLARQFERIEAGNKIRITRQGLGMKTSFLVEREEGGEWLSLAESEAN